MKETIALCNLPEGIFAKVEEVDFNGSKKRRFFDMGILKEASLKALYKSPAGDPKAYEICGAVIALRNEDAGKIKVSYYIDEGTGQR